MTPTTTARSRALRTGMWGGVALGGVGAVVLAATLVQAIVHANADTDYQVARAEAQAQYRAAVAAHHGLDRAHGRAAALREATQRIHDEAEAGGLLLPPKLKEVRAGLGDLGGVLRRPDAPTPGAAPRPAGTSASSTAQLQSETKRLFALIERYRACAADAKAEASRVDRGVKAARDRLTRVVDGGRPGKDTTAVPGLDRDAAQLLRSLTHAGPAERHAVDAAAGAARAGVAAGRNPAPLLLEYLAAAGAAREAAGGRH